VNSLIVSIIAILGLTILGIFIIIYIPGETKLLYGIIAIIAGFVGHYVPPVVNKYIQGLKRRWRNG